MQNQIPMKKIFSIWLAITLLMTSFIGCIWGLGYALHSIKRFDANKKMACHLINLNGSPPTCECVVWTDKKPIFFSAPMSYCSELGEGQFVEDNQ